MNSQTHQQEEHSQEFIDWLNKIVEPKKLVDDPVTLRDLKHSIEDEISAYIDEWIMDKLERFVEYRIEELSKDISSIAYGIEEKLGFEMYKMRKELEEQFHLNSNVTKKSFWKWWK